MKDILHHLSQTSRPQGTQQPLALPAGPGRLVSSFMDFSEALVFHREHPTPCTCIFTCIIVFFGLFLGLCMYGAFRNADMKLNYLKCSERKSVTHHLAHDVLPSCIVAGQEELVSGEPIHISLPGFPPSSDCETPLKGKAQWLEPTLPLSHPSAAQPPACRDNVPRHDAAALGTQSEPRCHAQRACL